MSSTPLELTKPIGEDPLEWSRFYWKQRFEGPDDYFMAMTVIMRASAMIVGRLEEVLKKYDLTRSSFLFLMSLFLSPQGARKLSRIGKYLLVHPTTVTMLADQLEARKLVVRKAHPDDRRATLCHLTASGRVLVESATRDLEQIQFGLPKIGSEKSQILFDYLAEICNHAP